MATPAAAAASAMSAAMARMLARRKHSSMTNAADSHAGGGAPDGQVVHGAVHRDEWPIDPAGNRSGWDHERVGREGQPITRRQGQGAASAQWPRSSPVSAAEKAREDGADKERPRPCPRAVWAIVTTSSVSRGRRRRKSRSARARSPRGPPPHIVGSHEALDRGHRAKPTAACVSAPGARVRAHHQAVLQIGCGPPFRHRSSRPGRP